MAQPFYQVGPGCSHEAFEGAYFDSGSVESGHVVYEKSGKYITYGYGDTAGIWCLQLVHGDATANYFSPGVGGDDPPAGTWTGYGEHAGESVTVSAGAVPIATEPDDAEEIAADVEGAEDLGALPPVLGPAEAGMLPPLLVEDEPPAGDAREDEWEEPIATPIEPPIRHYAEARGLYRVWNAPKFRIYRTGPYVASWPPVTEGEPPAEGDPPWETCDALPYSPAGTFTTGVWLIALSYFNGVLDSGFYPLGPKGEPYRRLFIDAGGQEAGNPPEEPTWSVEAIAGGRARVRAVYAETGPNRADQWALQLKPGVPPPANPEIYPPIPADIAGDGVAVWTYDSDPYMGGTMYARLYVRRNDGTPEVPVWVYSAATLKSVALDNRGAQVEHGEIWRGPLPMET